MAGFCVAGLVDFHGWSEANSDRHPDTTTGWSSTINTLVADLAVSCIIVPSIGINRHFAQVEKRNLRDGS